MILGGGLVGSVSAMCLARAGHSVALIDEGRHPRFTAGETMMPEMLEWLQILRHRFDVPELEHLYDIAATTRRLGPHHGQMQNLGFVRHVDGNEPDPNETTMFVNPTFLPLAGHLYRQEVDQFYFDAAARYGVDTRQNWSTDRLDVDDAAVTVTGADGEVFRARYLIDAGGPGSPLAEALDLRERPAAHTGRSRSLHAHFIGVKRFDDVSHHPRSLRPPVPWHGGTLHHTFRHGWFWITPFDNVEQSTNPLASVGLVLDPRHHPNRERLTPQEEFASFLGRFPAIGRQFADARRVTDWTVADRQYSSKQTVGRRWCLMSEAAGSVDPLFARALPGSMEIAHAVVRRVDQALKDDDFSVERFARVDELHRGLLHFSDLLAGSAVAAFGHFRLWHAFFRLWGAFRPPGMMRLTRARVHFQLTGDTRHLDALEDGPNPGMWWPENDVFAGRLKEAARLIAGYAAGTVDPDRAADRIFAMTRDCDAVPAAFGWKKDETAHFFRPTPVRTAQFMYWITRQTPPGPMRDLGRSVVAGTFRATLKGKLH